MLASSAWTNAKNECSVMSCTDRAKALSDHDLTVNDGTASTIAFIAGGALVATGIVLVLVGGGHANASSGGLVVAPTVGMGFGGVGVSGGF